MPICSSCSRCRYLAIPQMNAWLCHELELELFENSQQNLTQMIPCSIERVSPFTSNGYVQIRVSTSSRPYLQPFLVELYKLSLAIFLFSFSKHNKDHSLACREHICLTFTKVTSHTANNPLHLATYTCTHQLPLHTPRLRRP